FDTVTYSGTVSGDLKPVTASGVGAHTVPAHSGVGAATVGKVSGAASGVFAEADVVEKTAEIIVLFAENNILAVHSDKNVLSVQTEINILKVA
ncbi:MAG: hypothetical protein V7727_15515, partial [Sneathiella sp.]